MPSAGNSAPLPSIAIQESPLDAHIKNYFKDISLGQTAEYEKQVTDEDVRKFADISGDYNPIHLDDEFAKDSMFGARIAHGILTASHISRCDRLYFSGTRLDLFGPIPAIPCAGQNRRHGPYRCRSHRHRSEKNIVELSTICKVGDTVVLKGTATIKSPD